MSGGDSQFRVEPLDDRHDRAAFTCESEAQTDYFRKIARQHDANGMSAVFVLVESATRRVAGYYTLSMHSIAAGEIPPDVQKANRRPRGGNVPAALIGRLARDLAVKDRSIGTVLAYDALKRVRDAREHVGCVAVIVDPDGDDARRFWIGKAGFLELPGQSRLFLPMATVERLP